MRHAWDNRHFEFLPWENNKPDNHDPYRHNWDWPPLGGVGDYVAEQNNPKARKAVETPDENDNWVSGHLSPRLFLEMPPQQSS